MAVGWSDRLCGLCGVGDRLVAHPDTVWAYLDRSFAPDESEPESEQRLLRRRTDGGNHPKSLESLTVSLSALTASSFVFKGKPNNIHDAGRKLDVQYIVEGSVLRLGDQLRINAELIRVRDDFPLWSGRYDRELTDVFAIQDDEISRGIVNSLRLNLGRGRRTLRNQHGRVRLLSSRPCL